MHSCLFKTWQAFSFLFFQCLLIYSFFKLPLVHMVISLFHKLTLWDRTFNRRHFWWVHCLWKVLAERGPERKTWGDERKIGKSGKDSWRLLWGFFLCWSKPQPWALLQWFVGERSGWLHTLAPYYVAMTFLSLSHSSTIMLTLIPWPQRQQMMEVSRLRVVVPYEDTALASLISSKMHTKLIKVHLCLLSLLI